MIKEKFINAFMDVAERFAQLSSAKRLNVGAIVVKDDRIVSIGYNGMPSGWDNECEEVASLPHWANSIDDIPELDREIYVELKTKPEVLHAEANAITKLARSHESGEGASIFITHSPCIECAKLIYQSGISTVYYKNYYRSTQGVDFLTKSGVDIKKI
jgi:dCMP deaminase